MNERGLSLVELLVGMAVGLFMIAAALGLYVDHLQAVRRSLLGARLDQDLRSLQGLVARELRRAGYAREAGSAGAAPAKLGAAVTADASSVAATYGAAIVPDGASRPSTAFRVSGAALQMRRIGADGSSGWQTVTDPAVVQVTAFAIEHRPQHIEALGACNCIAWKRCDERDLLASPDRPRLTISRVDLRIRLRARQVPHLEREARDTIAVRNEGLEGHCP